MTLLIQSLLNPSIYNHPVDKVELIQTHISWVILTGQFAYKIKKPVNFGFLDFSSLQKRKYFCEEELRINRRLAPELYLEVVNITGTDTQPLINGTGDTLEYAVKMRQFPAESLLLNMIDNGDLREVHMDWLAHCIANFHQNINSADIESDFGTPTAIEQPVRENFIQIRSHTQGEDILQKLGSIEKWSAETFQVLELVIQGRRKAGFVRECHGDLHLGNIILMHEKIIPFDCIEFNENLRWIDVLSEIAFLVMDLEDHQRPDLAGRFLNKYLEYTGDYSDLRLFQFYKMYRAMVRAKVSALQITPEGLPRTADQYYNECDNYISLGKSYTVKRQPVLILMHGFSGSGKTTISQLMVEALPVIRIRSDIERKRLHNLKPEDSSQSETGKGIYDDKSSNETYIRLRRLAEDILLAGMTVIVDSAFLKQEQRRQFIQLASALATPCRIIDCHAEHAILEQRITERQAFGNDASEASLNVLLNQQENHDPLTEDEKKLSFTVDSTEVMALKSVTEHIDALIHGRIAPDSFSDTEILRHT